MANVVYRELLPPTGPASAVFARITTPTEFNLVIARNSGLDVFRRGPKGLILEYTCELAGIVKSLAVATVRGAASAAIGISVANQAKASVAVQEKAMEADVLVITFGFAKVVLLGWDALGHCLTTLGMFNFEESAKGVGCGVHVSKRLVAPVGYTATPTAHVDPKQTCVAMVVCEDQLVVLPFRQDELEGVDVDIGASLDGAAPSSDGGVVDPWAEAAATVDRQSRRVCGPAFVCSLPSLTSPAHLEGVEGTVIAVTFLQGYYQPTMCFLTEPSPSAISRLALKNFTCSITVVSLDVLANRGTIIWKFDGLPTDARQVIPVPEPAGGVLVISTNAITYLNQHYSLTLGSNSFASVTVDSSRYRTMFNPPDLPLDIAMDGATICFVSPTLALLSIKSGELYTIRLHITAGAVSAITIEPELVTVGLTYTFAARTFPDHVLLFQGCRQCDSLLLSLTITRPAVPATTLKRPSLPVKSGESESTKRAKVADSAGDDLDDWLYGDSASALAEEELVVGPPEVSGDDSKAKLEAVVVDSLPNLGPVADSVLGLSTRVGHDLSDVRVNTELLLCSGQGKRGAITILSRGLRPEVSTLVPVSHCVATFSVMLPETTTAPPCALLFVVMVTGTTRVFQVSSAGVMIETRLAGDSGAGAQLQGFALSDFVLDGITTGAALVVFPSKPGAAVLLQAHSYGVRVFGQRHTLQDVSVHYEMDVGGLGSPGNLVRDMQAVDNLAIVLLNDGTLRSMFIDPEDYDVTIQNPFDADGTGDRLLSDRSSITCFTTLTLPGGEAAGYPTELFPPTDADPPPTQSFCILARASGNVQWFSLPSWALVFECVLLHGPDVAVDVDAAAQPAEVSMPPSSPAVEVTEGTPTPTHPSVGSTIAALLFKCFPQPFLFVTLSNNDVFVYRVRPWAGDSNSPDASRWANSCPLRLIREAIPIPQRLRHIDSELLHASGMMKPLRPLVAITSLGGSSCGGVAILGATPFLAVPNKGGIAVLPLTPPSSHTVGGMNLKAPLPSVCMPFPVTAFSEINLHSSILSCVYSFEGSLHMGHLPNIEEFTLYHTRGSSTSVVANVIELDCAARLAVFLSFTSTPSSQMYAVAVCADMDADLEAEAAREMQTLMEEGEEHDQMSMRWGPKEELASVDPTGDEAPLLTDLAFEIRLYIGGTWEYPTSFPLELNEHALCMGEVSLLDSRDRPQHLIAVGTGFHTSRGEDANPTGRLLLLQVASEDGEPALRVYHAKAFKGLVTAIAYLQGLQRYIVVAAGSKIEVLTWKQERAGPWELMKVAFFDVFSYVTDLHVVKSFIMFADAFKSVHFLKLTEMTSTSCTLSYLGKDYSPLSVSSSQFLADGRTLLIAAADMRRNVQFFQYEPPLASEDVTLAADLKRRADFNVGSIICKMVAAKMNHTTAAVSGVAPLNRFALLFGTVDGGLGAFVPVDEVSFKRLLALQKLMTYALPHMAGLNPKDFRLFRNPESRRTIRSKHVVDGSLVWRYATLDRRLQREFARAINTTVDRILASLREVDLSLYVPKFVGKLELGVIVIPYMSGTGSVYDKKVVKPLSGKSVELGAAVQHALHRKGVSSRNQATLIPETTKLRAAVMSPAKVLATPSLPSTSSRTAPGTGSAPRLDDDHLNVLRLVFDFLDGDGDGELNDEELRVAVTTMGIPPAWQFLKSVKEKALPGRGVPFRLFVSALEERFRSEPISAAAVDDLFDTFDSGAGPDHIHGDRIRQLLSGVKTVYGTQLSDTEVDELFNDLAVKDSEVVDYKQFVLALTSGFSQLDWKS